MSRIEKFYLEVEFTERIYTQIYSALDLISVTFFLELTISVHNGKHFKLDLIRLDLIRPYCTVFIKSMLRSKMTTRAFGIQVKNTLLTQSRFRLLFKFLMRKRIQSAACISYSSTRQTEQQMGRTKEQMSQKDFQCVTRPSYSQKDGTCIDVNLS